MTIGPSLPPHLSKRIHEEVEEDIEDERGKRQRILGPVQPADIPATSNATLRTSDLGSSSLEDGVGPVALESEKRTRVLGPAPPPAPLDERPAQAPSNDSESSDEDDFGPAPPPSGSSGHVPSSLAKSAFDTEPQYEERAKATQRDAWMTMPPTQDDLSRMDPTKIRARKFNSGKGASSTGSGGGMGIWTETPEQKLKRLQDEAMGIAAPSIASSTKEESQRDKAEEEKAKQMRRQIEATRGKSLVEQHKDAAGKDKEDDPSKRVFDYEKDMALGAKISHKQKRDMLDKAKGFGDRFSKGSFL